MAKTHSLGKKCSPT